MERPVALSMFPDHVSAKRVGPLVGSVVLDRTNAALIEQVAPLYLDGRSVLDVTYGRGLFWQRYRPDRFAWHDLAVDGVDFRDLPERDGAYDVVVFDPPYVWTGVVSAHSRAMTEFRGRYGIGAPRCEDDLVDLIRGGLVEVARVAGEFVVVKCGDWRTASAPRRMVCGPTLITDIAPDTLVLRDVFVHVTGQKMGGHNIRIQHTASRWHSYLLVFEVAS